MALIMKPFFYWFSAIFFEIELLAFIFKHCVSMLLCQRKGLLLLSKSFSAQKCKVASKIAWWHYNFAKVVELGLYSSRNGSIHKILFHLLAKNSLLIVRDCCEKMSNQALKDFRISFKITQVFLQEKDQKFVGYSLMNLPNLLWHSF